LDDDDRVYSDDRTSPDRITGDRDAGAANPLEPAVLARIYDST
jgi:hypothetical protein